MSVVVMAYVKKEQPKWLMRITPKSTEIAGMTGEVIATFDTDV
jgi:hypothetical protein